MSFYNRHYVQLRRACFRLLLHGVRFDRQEAGRKAAELIERKEAIKDELDALIGYKLYSEKRHRSQRLIKLLAEKKRLTEEKNAIPKELKAERKAKLAEIKAVSEKISELRSSGGDVTVERGTGLSDQRIAEYLYRKCGVPVRRKRRKETGKITETVDDVTLKKIKHERPDLEPVINRILEHRKCVKLLGYLSDDKVDSDGRMRSFYAPYGTQTGRLSSKENPLETGMNLQNPARELKYLFIPDEG